MRSHYGLTARAFIFCGFFVRKPKAAINSKHNKALNAHTHTRHACARGCVRKNERGSLVQQKNSVHFPPPPMNYVTILPIYIRKSSRFIVAGQTTQPRERAAHVRICMHGGRTRASQ